MALPATFRSIAVPALFAVAVSLHSVPTKESCMVASLPDIRAQIEPLKRAHRYREARDVVLEGLVRIKASCGEANRPYANALRDLADIERMLNRLADARDHTATALAIREQLPDVDASTLVANRWQLGAIELQLSRQEVARPLIERALAEVTRTPLAATSLHAQMLLDLARLEAWDGHFAKAENALAQARSFLDAGGRATARVEFDSAAAHLYRDLGMLDLAEQYLRALDTHLRHLDQAEPGVAMLVPMNNCALARVLTRAGRADEAARLARDALAAMKDWPEQLRWLTMAPRLALVEAETALGHPAVAVQHAQAALALGATPLQEAEISWALGAAQGALGQFADARRHAARAVELEGGAAGEPGPRLLRYLETQARLAWGAGDAAAALDHFRELQTAFDRLVLRSLVGLPEARQRAVLGAYADGLALIVSFHFAEHARAPGSLALAVDAVLQRKGRQLDTAASLARLARAGYDASAVKAAGALKLLDARLAAARLDEVLESGATAAASAQMQDLLQRRTAFEHDLVALLPTFEALRAQATGARVAAALPRDAVLVEYLRYTPLSPSGPAAAAAGEARWAAFVVRPGGIFASVDLGAAAPIDARARGWLDAIAQRDVARIRSLGRELDAQLLAPVLAHTAGKTRLHITGDGATATIPFAALIGPSGRYRIEDGLRFSHLTTGSELLRELDRRAAEPPVVMGAPTFDTEPADLTFQRLIEGLGEIGSAASAASRERPAASQRTPEQDYAAADQQLRSAGDTVRSGIGRFPPLAGAEQEALAVAKLLSTKPIVGAEATKLRFGLVTQRAPRVLHIATHAYLLDAGAGDAPPRRVAPTALLLGEGALPAEQASTFDPMLRAGIALAGANVLREPRLGLVTALELASTDLARTELVVLSACKTAGGAPAPGESVTGLRRALEMSGAHASLTTLWSVADQPTVRFMTLFYGELLANPGDYAGAVANAQRAMLADSATAAPAHWAPFVLSGRASAAAPP